MTVEVYTFTDKDDNEAGFQTQDIQEARMYAKQHRLRLVANTYEWAESEVLEDHTPKRKQKK